MSKSRRCGGRFSLRHVSLPTRRYGPLRRTLPGWLLLLCLIFSPGAGWTGGADVLAGEAEPQTLSAEVLSVNQTTQAADASGVVDVGSLTEISAGEVRRKIDSYGIPDNAVYLDGALRGNGDLDDVIARRNAGAVSDPVNLRYGIIASNTMLRRYPTWKKLSVSASGTADVFQESMLLIGEGVAVLHQSTDGIWSFVQSRNDFGWVETARVAFCSREEMNAYLNSDRFLIVTDSLLHSGDVSFRMGTRLPVTEETESGYLVELPRVSGSGTLYFSEISLARSASVSCGYLSGGADSFVLAAKRLLHMPYGEGDTGGCMDNVSALDAIFLCFGVILPRHLVQMGYTGAAVRELSGMSREEKVQAIASCSPGSILLLEGHAVLYLGILDGRPQIFQQVTSYSTEDGALINANEGVITPLDVCTPDGTSYLDLYSRAISVW